jgi:hypothetical protein
MKNRKHFTAEQKALVVRVTRMVQRICGLKWEDAFVVAKDACIFSVPRRYVGGKTAARGYQ